MDNNNVALITKMVLEAVEKQKSSEKEPGYLVPVGVSARHIHLTQEHLFDDMNIETLEPEGEQGELDLKELEVDMQQ